MSNRLRRPLLLVSLALSACGGEGGHVCLDCADTGSPSPGGDTGPTTDAVPPGADAAIADGSSPDAASADAATQSGEQKALLSVPETRRVTLPGLSAPVQVVRTEADIPHLYAETDTDLARVQGYVTARDRFFMMDLARRLAQGRIAALLGDAGLATDITSRTQGMTEVAARMATNLTPRQRASWQAYAEGVNAYIEAVRAGDEEPPSELKLAAPLLGFRNPVDAMAPFAVEDLAAFATTVLFQSGFEREDLQRELALRVAGDAAAALPDAQIRQAGLMADIYERVTPLANVASIEGWPGATPPGMPPVGGSGGASPSGWRPSVPVTAAQGLLSRLQSVDHLFGHIAGEPFGSNAWAVGSSGTPDGSALLAGDGHLSLSVPSLFYQTGLDTSVFGGGDTRVMGLVVPGLPPLGVGTNGRVAWSFTYFYADLIDWYAEDIQLGPDGLPAASRFGDDWQPLRVVEETYTVANVPVLMSVGREQVERRFELFDGRRLMAIEGRKVAEGEVPAVVLDFGDGPWVPADVDGDGHVSGISADYTGLDAFMALDAYETLSRAGSVEEFRTLHKRLAVFGSHFNVADAAGHILDTGYHAVPCRQNLQRTPDARWAPGADPGRLLNGTRFGGFRIPFNADGTVDETAGAADPSACVVPFENFPAVIDPVAGYVFTANNDPGGYSFDGNLANDREYIGASWDLGLRGRTIRDTLAGMVRGKSATPESMSALQGNHFSPMGERYVPAFLEVLARVANDPGLSATFASSLEDFAAVAERLAGWRDRGFKARSGVATFYAEPTELDRADAVATMLFNAWYGHFVRAVFDDEGLPAVDRVGDRDTVIAALDRIWRGRGPENPEDLATWVAERGESVYFDDTATPEIETSEVLLLRSLERALVFLRSPPEAPGEGGFGTEDMDGWLWGLRHTVRLESLLIEYLGAAQPGLADLFTRFSITPRVLPLAPDLPEEDPRAGLVGFPRDGDAYSVDAAHPGARATRFEYRHGPVFRLVVRLKEGEVSGSAVLPGGQSGLNNSPHFADQAARWLGNETLPLRFHVADVVAGAAGREVFSP